jgi:hypothetical protein
MMYRIIYKNLALTMAAFIFEQVENETSLGTNNRLPLLGNQNENKTKSTTR